MIARKISIAGREIEIQRQPIDDYGNYYADQNLIIIDSSLTEEEARRTLIHEILHAALYLGGASYSSFGGDSDLEEGAVRCIENLALPVIMEIIKEGDRKERRTTEKAAAKKKKSEKGLTDCAI